MPKLEENFSKIIKEWRDNGLVRVGTSANENVAGKVLKTRSGELARDVQSNQQVESPNAFSIGTSLIYGKAWEQGFDRKAYTVRPRNAKALRFQPKGLGEFIFRMSASIPAQRFSAKAFLRPAIEENKEYLTKDLGQRFRVANDSGKLLEHRTITVNLVGK